MKRWLIEEGCLLYECELDDGSTHIVDRSDLMDAGAQQKMVLKHEKHESLPRTSSRGTRSAHSAHGEGCEECMCPDCER